MLNRRKSFKAAAAALTAAASLFAPAMTSAPGRPDKDPGEHSAAPRAKAAPQAATSAAPERSGTITLAVSLIWEGRDLAEHNLAALNAFRQEFGSVPLIHFVSPAYFTKPGANASTIKSRLGAIVRPNESVGLYLAGWKSLTQRAGVAFRNGPTFWGPAIPSKDCRVDCGLEVPVHLYPDDDLANLIASGRTLLTEQGFAPPIAMATAGWVAAPSVLEAASRKGIRYDFSAVSPEVVVGRLGNFPIYSWVKGLWPQTTPHTQPYVQPTRSAGVTEYPQSLAAMDYLTVKDVTAVLSEYVNGIKHGDGEAHRVLPLVIYQESAAVTLPGLKRALQDIFAASQKAGIALDWLQLPSATPTHATPATQPLAH